MTPTEQAPWLDWIDTIMAIQEAHARRELLKHFGSRVSTLPLADQCELHDVIVRRFFKKDEKTA